MLRALVRTPGSRVATVFFIVIGLLYTAQQAIAAGLAPFASIVGPQAFETVAEVWCISALPALWFAERTLATPIVAFASALVPPIAVELALFTFGSLIASEEELGRNVQIMMLVIGVTTAVSCTGASLLLLLRRARSLDGYSGA